MNNSLGSLAVLKLRSNHSAGLYVSILKMKITVTNRELGVPKKTAAQSGSVGNCLGWMGKAAINQAFCWSLPCSAQTFPAQPVCAAVFLGTPSFLTFWTVAVDTGAEKQPSLAPVPRLTWAALPWAASSSQAKISWCDAATNFSSSSRSDLRAIVGWSKRSFPVPAHTTYQAWNVYGRQSQLIGGCLQFASRLGEITCEASSLWTGRLF